MPAGSTPRLVMCVACGLVALWIATSVMTGPAAPIRFAALVGLALGGARVFVSDEVAGATTGAAALVLTVAAASLTGDVDRGAWPFVAGAIVAAVAAWFPRKRVEPR